MIGKYDKLTEHLVMAKSEPYTMSFKEIEEVIGDGLPNSAYKHSAWWANSGKAQSQAWMRVGRRTIDVQVASKQVTFTTNFDAFSREDEHNAFLFEVKALSIDEAKAGLSKKFGVPKENIEIIIKG